MAYFAEALSIQHGCNETERRFVWLQSPEYTGAVVTLAALADFELLSQTASQEAYLVFP